MKRALLGRLAKLSHLTPRQIKERDPELHKSLPLGAIDDDQPLITHPNLELKIMTTTTSIEIDDELLSRCMVLTVDESPEQTARIHAHQRGQMSLGGLVAREHAANIMRLHKNAQRLLRPVKVVLPDTDALTFPDLRVRARRDHRKLLALIEVLALLHQHQRELKRIEQDDHIVECIEATDTDIAVATELMEHIGGIGVDDLPPATRKLLEQLDGYVSEQAAKLKGSRPEVRFSRRQIREALQLGDTQCKVHLRRLVDAEFVLAHRAPHGRGVVYSLAFNGNGHAYDAGRSVSGRGKVGPRVGQGRGEVGSRPRGSTLTKKSGQRQKRGQAFSKTHVWALSQEARRTFIPEGQALMPAKGWRKPLSGRRC